MFVTNTNRTMCTEKLPMKRYAAHATLLLFAGILTSCGGGGDTPSGDASPVINAGGTPATPGGGTPATPSGTPATPSAGSPSITDNGTPATPSAGASATPSGGTPGTAESGTPATPNAGTSSTPTDGTASSPSAGNPGTSAGGGTPASGGGAPPPPVTARFEESDAKVSISAGWSPGNSIAGWSGGKAVQSDVAGATISFSFTGTSVRWIGSRGRGMGIALVKVDDGPAKEVDLFARPNDEISTPIITFYDLSDGEHTLTIEVTGRHNPDPSAHSSVVVVDAFDVYPQIVSHYQDADPDLAYSGSWDVDTRFGWSGTGAGNAGDPPVGARFNETAGASVTLSFRGTSITWRGYRGPDAGIALVQVDAGKPDAGKLVEIDTYAERLKVQEAVYMSPALADTDHTLTITVTGRKNDKSSAAKIFVDAFDVTTPGKRVEADDPKNADPSMSFVGAWNFNQARVWSDGATTTSNQANASVTFSFTGTSVSWIGCSKASAGGSAKILIDGALKKEVSLGRRVGIEGYQRTIYREDGLTNGPHTLMLIITSTTGAYVVVDAFDVHPEPPAANTVAPVVAQAGSAK